MSQVLIRWERKTSGPAAEPLRRLVVAVLRRLGEERGEVHLLLTGDRRLRELNRTFRGVDAATDVLSFPDGDELPSGNRLLGEIAISVDAVRRQAYEAGHGELEELLELALHGILHLLGHDHETDRGEMAAVELELRQEVLP